jgi:N-acetyl-gamma-glutamylphosphate reductase
MCFKITYTFLSTNYAGLYESTASNFLSNPALQKAACITDLTVEVPSFSGVSGAGISHMSTMHKQFKMAHVINTHMKQRVVTEFLAAEERSPTEIHRCMNCVYGEYTVYVNTVRC